MRLWCGALDCITTVWVRWPRAKKKKKIYIFKNAGVEFCCRASLHYLRSAEHQKNSLMSVFFFVFSPTLDIHITANADVIKLYGGKMKRGLGARWWARLVLAETYDALEWRIYFRREQKMGRCLSAASLMPYWRNNWSAFVDTLILIRPNPLFSPQWIHR